jgi:hypothetical protein
MGKDRHTYRYVIDEEDRIVSVSDNWTEFALENNAGEGVIPPDVIGRSLFDYIPDEDTKGVYKIILDSIRETRSRLKIPINCDSPDLRRKIDIDIKWRADNGIEFISRIVNMEKRDPVNILDPTFKRSKQHLRICSFCKKIEVEIDRFMETEKAIKYLDIFKSDVFPELHQVVCMDCVQRVSDSIQEMKDIHGSDR